jgi:hypothetical protein
MRLALALAALAVGCTQTSTPPPQPTPFVPGLSFGPSEAGLDHGVTFDGFSVYRLRDLFVRAKVPSLPPGVTSLGLWFSNPQGELFFEDHVRFSTDATVTMTTDGEPVFAAKPRDGGFALDTGIPILGTIFQKYPNPGAWGVTASVDGVAGMQLTGTLMLSAD